MEDIYITDKIVIRDNKLYNDESLVKSYNWHRILHEIGWTKLHRNLIQLLNRYNDEKDQRNSLFGSLECGDDGDCLFHCIAYALNSTHECMYDSGDIREIIADSINEGQFNDIITIYRSMKDVGDFDEEWDPYDIKSLDDFKNEIKKKGHNYWGDFILIELMIQSLSINICILSQDELQNKYEKYYLPHTYDPSKKTILLLYENTSHFKLLGYFKDVMNVLFTDETLPMEIKRYYDV